MTVDLVDNEVDRYKPTMRDHPDGGFDMFFRSKSHNCSPNIPHNKVCIIFTYLFNFRPFFSFWSACFSFWSACFFHHICPFL
jgi:hypothetical protein